MNFGKSNFQCHLETSVRRSFTKPTCFRRQDAVSESAAVEPAVEVLEDDVHAERRRKYVGGSGRERPGPERILEAVSRVCLALAPPAGLAGSSELPREPPAALDAAPQDEDMEECDEERVRGMETELSQRVGHRCLV